MSFLLHHTLERSAERAPDRPAIVDRDRSRTYGELNEAANRLAHLLIDLGVRRGDRVGVYLDKSLDAVIGLYATMKAGAAYVPLDPGAPADRIAYIIGNCDIQVLLSGVKKAREWPQLVAETKLRHVVGLDTGDHHDLGGGVQFHGPDEVATRDSSDPEVWLIDQDLALMLYTSGSTGMPKGVMLSHRNVRLFVDWAVREFGVTAEDRLSQMAPLHFDLSTFDLYGAALAGACVHLVPKATLVFPGQVKKFLVDSRISVTYAVPSILTMLVEHAGLAPGDLPDLHTVLFAGEVFPTKYLARFMRLLPDATWANLYGPTETNVCTYYRVPEAPPEDGPPISIGRAIENVETFVVRDDGTVAVPGEIGELYVRGGTVMQGYWGDAERTARSRVENPFGGELRDPVYKTGDLVEELPDGNYRFLGRRDNQIKSRGYRIELGDIEAAIYAHPSVVEAAAIAVPDDQVTNRILGFVSVKDETTNRELVRFMGDRIPHYMIPESLDFRDNLPKTSNGKIDRQRLLRDIEESQ